MAIHMSTPRVTVVKESEVEIIAPPVIKTQPNVMARQPHRQYQHSTLFEGNDRRLLWDGQGSDVSEASSAMEVLRMAGLDFTVEMEPIFTGDGTKVPNMLATRRYDRLTDGTQIASTVYGVVSPRYRAVQNTEGFSLLDAMYGHNGFEVETAGQFDDGKIVWIEAKIPRREMTGEAIDPYLLFTNRHDGKGSVRVCFVPVRVRCKNTLNLALRRASRTFAVRHTTTANEKLEAAKETLNNYYAYLDAMAIEVEKQKRMCLGKAKVINMIEELLSFKESDTQRVKDGILVKREELKRVYENAPDLDGYEDSAFRFVNAVSDWATHRKPSRQTANYASNLFKSTLEGNEYIDAAYEMVNAMESTANKMIAVS